MFKNCHSLNKLNLSSFNTQEVHCMAYMFYDCSSLTSLDLSSFKTEKVSSMYKMFYGCSSLKTLDLSSFTTEKIFDHQLYFKNFFMNRGNGRNRMFNNNLTSFNNNKSYFVEMFRGCGKLSKCICFDKNIKDAIGK